MQIADSVAHLLAGHGSTARCWASPWRSWPPEPTARRGRRAGGRRPRGRDRRPQRGHRPPRGGRPHDDLTGLHDRRSWIDTVRRELEAGTAGTLLICDVDAFKTVNDVHGHRSGDIVLAEVARVLSRHGVTGRIGGDEFGVWVRGARS